MPRVFVKKNPLVPQANQEKTWSEKTCERLTNQTVKDQFPRSGVVRTWTSNSSLSEVYEPLDVPQTMSNLLCFQANRSMYREGSKSAGIKQQI